MRWVFSILKQTHVCSAMLTVSEQRAVSSVHSCRHKIAIRAKCGAHIMASSINIPFFIPDIFVPVSPSPSTQMVNAITKMRHLRSSVNRCGKALCINSFRLFQWRKSHQMHAEFISIQSVFAHIPPGKSSTQGGKKSEYIISESCAARLEAMEIPQMSSSSGRHRSIAPQIRQSSCDLVFVGSRSVGFGRSGAIVVH